MTAGAVFLFAAPDKPGLVGRIGSFFYERDINIVDASNHTDTSDGSATFFMRVEVDISSHASHESLAPDFENLCAQLDARGSVSFSDSVARVALLVTREAACLYDLVLRQREGELRCEFPLIISNRIDLEEAARSLAIPFVHMPISAETKPAQEAAILARLREDKITLVVLARYMQILSEDFLQRAPPVINIHHGFLPAFQGAKPYHQAHARGVKLIGATAHYATRDLDQGPIIEQDVARVTHRDGPEALVRIGRDVERVVLSRAVRAHLERRVFVQGRRTFIL